MNDDEQPAADDLEPTDSTFAPTGDAPDDQPAGGSPPEPPDDGQPVDPAVEPEVDAPDLAPPGSADAPDRAAVTEPIPFSGGAAGTAGELSGAATAGAASAAVTPDDIGGAGDHLGDGDGDGDGGGEPAPKRRGLQIALGAVGVVALGGAIWFGVSQMSSETSAGAASPEEAVANMFDAIEARDVVGLLETVDPAERETIGEGATDVLDELVRLEVLEEPAGEPGVPGFTIEFNDLEYATESVDDDIADVSVTGGTVDTTLTPSELPIGALLVENGVDPSQEGEVSSSGQPIELDDVVFTTVERDGDWYVSLWYSIAENARLDAGLPMPDAADVPEPVGADSPGEAVQAMIDATTALDVNAMIGMLDPAEASALYRYSPLFLPDVEAAVAEIPGFDLQIGGLEFPTESDGDRAVVRVVPGDEVTVDMSVPSEGVDVSAVFAGGGMTAQMTSDGEEVEVSTEDFECFDFVAAGETESVCTSDLEDAEAFGAQLDALSQFEWPFAPEQMERFTAAYGDAGVATVQRDGRWYLSPTHTLFDLSLRGVRHARQRRRPDAHRGGPDLRRRRVRAVGEPGAERSPGHRGRRRVRRHGSERDRRPGRSRHVRRADHGRAGHRGAGDGSRVRARLARAQRGT